MTEDDSMAAEIRAFEEACSAVNSLLSTIGSEHGQSLSLDETGSCAFDLGKDVPVMVSVTEHNPRVVVFAPVAPLPDNLDQRLAVCVMMLERNLLEPALGGGSIAIDPDSGLLVVSHSAEIDGLIAAKLGGLLESAYGAVQELREVLGFDPDMVRSDELSIEPPLVIKA